MIGIVWLLVLPHEGLWKDTYVDEHALQPAQVSTRFEIRTHRWQVTMYYDWADVHGADRYLDDLERLVNATIREYAGQNRALADRRRSTYIQTVFSSVGLSTSNTSESTYGHVRPPRSAGTETILISANWVSREGTPNLRGVAMLLSLGEFLRGELSHW